MKEFECKVCNKRFDAEESLRQHNISKHEKNAEETNNKKNIKKYILLFLFISAIAVVSTTFYIRGKQASPYDNFALCLKEKATIYGNDFCQYTTKQLNMFGKSSRNLDYVKCIDNKELCDSKNVKITPTWEIEGKMYEGVQSFENLDRLTGCKV